MNVFVNGKPAVRIGDPTTHCGGAGTMIAGSSNVIVGSANSVPIPVDDAKKIIDESPTLENQLGDLIEKGYEVGYNESGKVGYIGPNNKASTPYNGKAITIQGSDAFKKKTLAALNDINKTQSGAKMLQSIEESGRTVTITETSGGNGAMPMEAAKARRKPDSSPGEGCSSKIKYNPDRNKVGDGSEPWMTRPAAMGLAHELVHAAHSANGTNDFTPKGEDMAVGVPPYDKEPFSENTMRSEWDPKQPIRPNY